jgi:hypothetical protein
VAAQKGIADKPREGSGDDPDYQSKEQELVHSRVGWLIPKPAFSRSHHHSPFSFDVAESLTKLCQTRAAGIMFAPPFTSRH